MKGYIIAFLAGTVLGGVVGWRTGSYTDLNGGTVGDFTDATAEDAYWQQEHSASGTDSFEYSFLFVRGDDIVTSPDGTRKTRYRDRGTMADSLVKQSLLSVPKNRRLISHPEDVDGDGNLDVNLIEQPRGVEDESSAEPFEYYIRGDGEGNFTIVYRAQDEF